MANPVYRSQYTAAQIEALLGHGTPIIQNGTWWTWDISTGAYVDTGLSAEGADSWHGLANDFSSSASYAVGDLVMYNGELYVCTTAHSGAWDASDFKQTTINEQKASWAVALGAYPTETKTGATAETSIGADNVPIKSLIAEIEYVWSGSGTPSPSNIREISGHTGLNITHGENTISVSWQTEAGAVYGGEIDLATGILTVTHRAAAFTGAESSWQDASADYPRYQVNIGVAPAYPDKRTEAICSHYAYGSSGDSFSISSSGYSMFFYPGSGYSTLASFQTYLAGQYSAETPVTICYYLNTPLVYQLTPIEVKSLLGANTISSDIGDVSVTYRCDPNLYIAAQIAAAINP